MITPWLAPASLPPGQRIYAVGDVHGCSDRLRAMHREIARDLVADPVAEAQVVHLGDYVDRGPDSAGVIELLLQPPFPPGGDGPVPRVVNLMGNHEAMRKCMQDHANDLSDACKKAREERKESEKKGTKGKRRVLRILTNVDFVY